jgi:hypothetical protein
MPYTDLEVRVRRLEENYEVLVGRMASEEAARLAEATRVAVKFRSVLWYLAALVVFALVIGIYGSR